MTSKNILYLDAVKVLEEYSKSFNEDDAIRTLDFVRSSESSISRTNMGGHLTASGVVLKDDKLLLILHKKLQRYIQPGGHIEDIDTSLMEAAQREVFEETGLSVEQSPLFTKSIPFHIDIHTIPENPKKGEVEHMHYDCMYLFTPSDDEIFIDLLEVDDYKWIPVNSKFDDRGLDNVVVKLNKMLGR